MLRFPESPRSTLSSLSATSGSPPALDVSTLALLDSFFASKAEEERRFNELSVEQAAAKVAGLALLADAAEDLETPMMSVDEYRLAFGEDWQLSQFWYTTACATKLARRVHALCTPTSNVAFICCPTAFVAFQHTNPLDGARLLEYDQRFAVLAPKHFVPYDLYEPESIPENLKGKIDIAIVDPPFLNKDTNTKLAQSLRLLLRPSGKLLLITSTSIETVLHQIYDATPIGPLRRTCFTIEYDRLANDFVSWGTWDGAEDFGKEDEKENAESS